MRDVVTQTLMGLVNIALFRASPVVLPYSKIVLCVIITLVFAAKVMAFSMIKGASFGSITMVSLLYILFLMTAVYLLFKQFRCPERTVKVLIALLGIDLLFSGMLNALGEPSPENLLLMTLLGVWILTIEIMIYKKSLEVRTAVAVLITLSINVFQSLPFYLFFGFPNAPA